MKRINNITHLRIGVRPNAAVPGLLALGGTFRLLEGYMDVRGAPRNCGGPAKDCRSLFVEVGFLRVIGAGIEESPKPCLFPYGSMLGRIVRRAESMFAEAIRQSWRNDNGGRCESSKTNVTASRC